VGHAIEAAARFADINHGEAVAVGMRVAGRLSTRMLGCPSDDVAWQDGMLDACGFTTPQALDRRALLDALQRDKKTVRDQVRWVLLKRRGEPLTGQQVVEDVLAAALDDVLRP
jgi:3-dehydroquinate synthase